MEDKQFKTSDMYFVAAAIVKGAELVLPLVVDNPRHIQFPLCGKKAKIDLDELYTRWVAGDLEGSLRRYSTAIKDVKIIIHTQNDAGSAWIKE